MLRKANATHPCTPVRTDRLRPYRLQYQYLTTAASRPSDGSVRLSGRL